MTVTATAHHPVGVVKLKKTVKVFYTAAFWRTLSSNMYNVESTAYDRDWLSRGMSHVVPITTMETMSPSYQRVNQIADTLADQMHDQFLLLVHTNCKAAAQAYANAVTRSGVTAYNDVQATLAAAKRHNDSSATEATRIAVGLSDTIFVSECALAFGACALSFGLAGPFFVGGAPAAMLLSSGYALAGRVVTSAQGGNVTTAIDPDFDTDQGSSVTTYGAGKGLDACAEAREEEIYKNSQTYKRAQIRIRSLSKKLGFKMKPGARAKLVKNIADAREEEVRVWRETKELERSKWMLKIGSTRVLPVIQAGVDVFFAIKAQQKRLDDMHVDWLGRDR